MAKSFQKKKKFKEIRPKYCKICYHKSKFLPVEQMCPSKKRPLCPSKKLWTLWKKNMERLLTTWPWHLTVIGTTVWVMCCLGTEALGYRISKELEFELYVFTKFKERETIAGSPAGLCSAGVLCPWGLLSNSWEVNRKLVARSFKVLTLKCSLKVLLFEEAVKCQGWAGI